jgi:photosystem II stability/assembly factor-like uncharacterized protein
MTGWIVGYDPNNAYKASIGKSIDGAMTGTVQANSDEPLYSIDFADAMIGWVVGQSGVILKTCDGGG